MKKENKLAKIRKIYAATTLTASTLLFNTAKVFAAGSTDVSKAAGMDTILNLIMSAAKVGGGIWLVWGAIVLGSGLKDHQGPQIQSGIWQIVGGAVVIAASALFKTVVTG